MTVDNAYERIRKRILCKWGNTGKYLEIPEIHVALTGFTEISGMLTVTNSVVEDNDVDSHRTHTKSREVDASQSFPRSKQLEPRPLPTTSTATTRTATMVLRRMDQEMITDITLDHLPDLSEENVSFQIPADNSSADFLLADATGFNALYNTMDDEGSFEPVAHLAAHPNYRGPTLTLAHLTPRAEPTTRLRPRSPSATPGPTLSISQPSEIPQPPTLRRSPRKRRETPSRAQSELRHLPLESLQVSEQPFAQLRVEGETTGHAQEELSSHGNIDVTAHDKYLLVKGRKTPSRTRSKRRSQLVTEGSLGQLPETEVLETETHPQEDVDVVVHETSISITRRRTPSRSSSRRIMRLVSEERLDQIPEVQALDQKLQLKPCDDDMDVVAHDKDAPVKRRRTPSRSRSTRRSQLVSEDHLEQIPEVQTLGLELETKMQPYEDVDVVEHDKALPRKRSKTPSRARSTPSVPPVSEERLDQIPEDHPLDQELESQENSDAASHDQLVSVKNAETLPCTSSNHLESAPVSEVPPVEQDTAVTPPEQDLDTQTGGDVVMVTQAADGADTNETAVPAPPKAKLKRNPRTKAKPTVAAGGISKAPALHNARMSKKPKNKPSSVREARLLPSSTARRASPPQSVVAIDATEKLVPPAYTDGDIDMTSENTKVTHPSTGGMAERLVSYSQKLISSIGLYKPWSETAFTEDAGDAVRAATHVAQPPATIPTPSNPQSPASDGNPSPEEDPLRLSEISPPKLLSDGQSSSAARVGVLQDGWQRAMSPMRPAKKRRSMEADLASQEREYEREQPCRKKGKTVLACTDPERRSSEEASSQAQPCPDKNTNHEDQRVTNSTRDRTRHHAVPKAVMPSARTKYRPKLHASSERKGPTLRALPYMASSRQVHGTIRNGKGKRDDERPGASTVRPDSAMGSSSASFRARRGETAAQGKTLDASYTRQRSGPTSTANLALAEKKPALQNAAVSVAQLTKPVAFTFRVDARLEARKIEERLAESEPGKTSQDRAVPDFKALHESHQGSFVFRKENVVPSVPVAPFFFYTEQRAKEREKFDEMVRRKEEEMQRLKEEQRRLEAEEEDRAIKELRRKAIPKANEVPEWYADMPKRKGTAV